MDSVRYGLRYNEASEHGHSSKFLSKKYDWLTLKKMGVPAAGSPFFAPPLADLFDCFIVYYMDLWYDSRYLWKVIMIYLYIYCIYALVYVLCWWCCFYVRHSFFAMQKHVWKLSCLRRFQFCSQRSQNKNLPRQKVALFPFALGSLPIGWELQYRSDFRMRTLFFGCAF